MNQPQIDLGQLESRCRPWRSTASRSTLSTTTATTALRLAAKELKKKERGGTSQYHAKGLAQAAKQFKGKANLDSDDVVSLAQTLLGAIPHPRDTRRRSRPTTLSSNRSAEFTRQAHTAYYVARSKGKSLISRRRRPSIRIINISI